MRAGGYRGPVPDDYALRHGDAARARTIIDALDVIDGIGGAGEVLLCASAPGQLHLAISISGSISGGLVHADAPLRRVVARPGRSEEHTSELQSLMRISYAVFCLKKKKTQYTPTQIYS